VPSCHSVNDGKMLSVLQVLCDLRRQNLVFLLVETVTVKQASDRATVFDKKSLLVGGVNDKYPVRSPRISAEAQKNHRQRLSSEVEKIKPERKRLAQDGFLHSVHRAEENRKNNYCGGLDGTKKVGILTNGPRVVWDSGASRGITVGSKKRLPSAIPSEGQK